MSDTHEGKAGYIARLWYQDNLNGQLLIGEVAWSPDGELVDVLPVCDERMQRVAVFAQWPELPTEAERWFGEISAGGLDDYRKRSESMGNAMSILQCGDLQPLYWDEWTVEDARAWLVRVMEQVT